MSRHKITTVVLYCPECGKPHAIGVTITPQAYTEMDPDVDFDLPENCLRCATPLDTYANVCDVMTRALQSVEVAR